MAKQYRIANTLLVMLTALAVFGCASSEDRSDAGPNADKLQIKLPLAKYKPDLRDDLGRHISLSVTLVPHDDSKEPISIGDKVEVARFVRAIFAEAEVLGIQVDFMREHAVRFSVEGHSDLLVRLFKVLGRKLREEFSQDTDKDFHLSRYLQMSGSFSEAEVKSFVKISASGELVLADRQPNEGSGEALLASPKLESFLEREEARLNESQVDRDIRLLEGLLGRSDSSKPPPTSFEIPKDKPTPMKTVPTKTK